MSFCGCFSVEVRASDIILQLFSLHTYRTLVKRLLQHETVQHPVWSVNALQQLPLKVIELGIEHHAMVLQKLLCKVRTMLIPLKFVLINLTRSSLGTPTPVQRLAVDTNIAAVL
jgi:hypothetical protein